MRTSDGRATLDDVGADLVGGDLFEPGAAVTVACEPPFCGVAIPGEVQEFRAIANILHDADHADRGTLDDLEAQVTGDAVDAADRDNDDARLAEIALMQGETGRRRVGRPFARRLLPDQPVNVVAALPGGKLLPEMNRRFEGAVGIADDAPQRAES